MSQITWGTHRGEAGEVVCTLFCMQCREALARDLSPVDAKLLKAELIESGAHQCDEVRHAS